MNMKKKKSLLKLARNAVSLMLCASVAMCCLASSAAADESGESSGASQSTPAPSEEPQTEATPEPEASPSAEPEASSAPTQTPSSEPSASPSAEPTASPTAEPTPTPTPEPTPAAKVTLTFDMGSFGTQTVTVDVGSAPDSIPDIPSKPQMTTQGWLDENGSICNPLEITASEDTTYTASWVRYIDDFLVTDTHNAYVSGYDDGTFGPEKSMTRAEAASMLYSLLRDKSAEKKSFSDVKKGQWYYEAVSTMAGLGVISGYPDGTFKPNAKVTRAEFLAMASACDVMVNTGSHGFSDVSAGSWYESYVINGTQKGWISGFEDGTFRPDSNLTRAQAVTIIDKMLGRSPDEDIKSFKNIKNFYDVYTSYWAYGFIAEASTDHSYSISSGKEEWTDYEKDYSGTTSKWVTIDGSRYYVDGTTGKFARGEHVIDGSTYYFDSSTGALKTGFVMIDGYRRYIKNGVLQTDISGLGVVSGPYMIKVYKKSNYLIIFAKDSSGKYNTPVRAMRVSCGTNTPVGTFYTPSRYRWLQMVGNTWAQWCTQIQGNYLFHSVPNWTKSNTDLEVGEYNHLGETRSLGCVRLNCRDAKWIYDNCALGTRVVITTSESTGPLSKPAGTTIPSWHTWDPTDPTAYYLCKKYGCH